MSFFFWNHVVRYLNTQILDEVITTSIFFLDNSASDCDTMIANWWYLSGDCEVENLCSSDVPEIKFYLQPDESCLLTTGDSDKMVVTSGEVPLTSSLSVFFQLHPAVGGYYCDSRLVAGDKIRYGCFNDVQ